MTSEELYWFAGYFEGEGSFYFVRDKPKGLTITSTDRDVLDKVVNLCGGHIYELTKRKPHWKDAWRWTITGEKARDLAREIEPLLMSRRKARCQEYIANVTTLVEHNAKRRGHLISNIGKAVELRSEGLTHKEIATILKVERSVVSHMLGKRYKDI